MVTADGVSLADHEGPIYYIDGFNVDFIMDKEWGIKRIPDGGFMGNPPELTITGGKGRGYSLSAHSCFASEINARIECLSRLRRVVEAKEKELKDLMNKA